MNGVNWQYVYCFFKSYPLSNCKRFIFLVWCMITRNNSSIFFKTIGNLNYSLLASSAPSQSLFSQVIVLDTQTSAGGLSSSPDLLPREDCVWCSPRGYRTCSYGRAVITPFVSWVWWNDSHSCTQTKCSIGCPFMTLTSLSRPCIKPTRDVTSELTKPWYWSLIARTNVWKIKSEGLVAAQLRYSITLLRHRSHHMYQTGGNVLAERQWESSTTG